MLALPSDFALRRSCSGIKVLRRARVFVQPVLRARRVKYASATIDDPQPWAEAPRPWIYAGRGQFWIWRARPRSPVAGGPRPFWCRAAFCRLQTAAAAAASHRYHYHYRYRSTAADCAFHCHHSNVHRAPWPATPLHDRRGFCSSARSLGVSPLVTGFVTGRVHSLSSLFIIGNRASLTPLSRLSHVYAHVTARSDFSHFSHARESVRTNVSAVAWSSRRTIPFFLFFIYNFFPLDISIP